MWWWQGTYQLKITASMIILLRTDKLNNSLGEKKVVKWSLYNHMSTSPLSFTFFLALLSVWSARLLFAMTMSRTPATAFVTPWTPFCATTSWPMTMRSIKNSTLLLNIWYFLTLHYILFIYLYRLYYILFDAILSNNIQHNSGPPNTI